MSPKTMEAHLYRGMCPVPIEVSLAWDLPNQAGIAEERGAYLTGESGSVFGGPSSRHMGFKHQDTNMGRRLVG